MKHLFTLTLALLLSSTSFVFAQQNVTGIVSDDSGIPLPGVNILEKGTTNGVITDFDGNYSITVNNEATLTFSYIGYTTQEIKVNNQTNINITLSKGVSLDEVMLVGSRSPRRTATDTPVPVDVMMLLVLHLLREK